MSELNSAISVTVNAFGAWQMILGIKRRQVRVGGRSVRELVETLDKIALGKLKKEKIIGPRGELDPRFRIFVNGTCCENIDATITDGDDVILFSAIDGG